MAVPCAAAEAANLAAAAVVAAALAAGPVPPNGATHLRLDLLLPLRNAAVVAAAAAVRWWWPSVSGTDVERLLLQQQPSVSACFSGNRGAFVAGAAAVAAFAAADAAAAWVCAVVGELGVSLWTA